MPMLPSWLQSFVERVEGRGWNRKEGEVGGGRGEVGRGEEGGKMTREKWRRTEEKKEWRRKGEWRRTGERRE